jgi:hypothetical protein
MIDMKWALGIMFLIIILFELMLCCGCATAPQTIRDETISIPVPAIIDSSFIYPYNMGYGAGDVHEGDTLWMVKVDTLRKTAYVYFKPDSVKYYIHDTIGGWRIQTVPKYISNTPLVITLIVLVVVLVGIIIFLVKFKL